jgi:hypothetical protein
MIWHSVYPDRFEDLKTGPVLLFFKDKDYDGIIYKYWKGEAIPVCEMAECLGVVRRIYRTGTIDMDWFFDMWDEIYDIRGDYKNQGNLSLLEDEDGSE